MGQEQCPCCLPAFKLENFADYQTVHIFNFEFPQTPRSSANRPAAEHRILSLSCAKAGAKHVYADKCSHMADMAKEIVKANGFSDVITFLKGKVEELELPVPKVDIITL
nr:protein arginine N-methyltransferase 1.1-like [Tanacetum cinerariifolium]